MTLTESSLEESLQQGYTLPAGWYSDPDLLQREQRLIFRKAWLYAGPVSQAPNPGDYFTCNLGDVPLVVVRGRDGELRAFVNVCRHRGTIVAYDSGNCAALQCPYHAWTYDLDGSLRAAPRSDDEPGFNPDEFGLLPVHLETWGPFILVNLDSDPPPLATVLGEVPAQLETAGLDLARLQFRLHDEWELKANWKITVENYLECYHCPVAHPEFSRVIDVRPEEYKLSSEGLVWSQVGPLRESVRSGNGATWARGPVADSQFHLIWPNLTLNTYPGPPNLAVSVYWPIDHERTLMVSDLFYGPDTDDSTIKSMMDFSAQVTREDQDLVEAVHLGLRSGVVVQGRLLLNSEHLIHRFQRLVYEALNE